MNDMIKKLLQIDQEILVEQIKHEEDENYYNVWKVIIDKKIYIFKKSSKIEESIYKLYLRKLEKGVPKLYKTITHNNEIYLLMEYFEGENICKASKDKLKVVLDNLIFEQNQFWNNVALDNPNYSYEYTILRRIDRGTYLKNSLIKKHYDKFY
jgi:serine/threonine protein kinase